ncbi:MAG: polysaccharide deacetylase family protein [Saccharospirillum sp.]
MIARLATLIAATALWAAQAFASVGPSFNVVIYHHVDTGTPPSTSVTPEQFREHLEYYRDNGFNVVPIDRAVDAVLGRNNATLPEKALVITFDDAYRSVYTEAFPLLKEFNMPATAFINTEPMDAGRSLWMSWGQAREMHEWGITIANHTTDHENLMNYRQEDEQAWVDAIMDNVDTAQRRIEEEIGVAPPYFAYPYGEYTKAIADRIAEAGYIGFAQHSGGVYAGSDFRGLPRFSADGIYANLNTLPDKLNSKPMPVDYDTVPEMVTTDRRPSMTIRVQDMSDMTQVINCFVNSQWTQAQWLSQDTFRLTAEAPLSEGRNRYNCTSRSRSGDFFYWYSQPWLVVAD